MYPTLYIADDLFSLAESLAVQLEKWNQEAENVPFHIALSGGTTPKLFFDLLSVRYPERLKWANIHLWWGDERCVAPDDDESNYKWVKKLLLDQIDIPEGNIHRIHGEAIPEEEAIRYRSEMLKQLDKEGDIPIFDLIILGMGEDGHTASIFPDNLQLIDSDECCAVAVHPQSGQKRITLTGKVINAARRVVFLVNGFNKAEKIKAIIDQLPGASEYPAAHINPVHGRLYWFLDRDASLLLS